MLKTICILAATTQARDEFDELLDAHELYKVLRICAWIRRFVTNCRNRAEDRQGGPLDADEIQEHRLWRIKGVQKECQEQVYFSEYRLQLNLQPNSQAIIECRGRIEGEFPIYLPDSHPFSREIVRQARSATLHGEVSFTMRKMREVYRIPRLRSLVKKVSMLGLQAIQS